MKPIFLSILSCLAFTSLSAQFVAKAQIKGPLPGACDTAINVYALFAGFGDQVKAVPPISAKAIEDSVNNLPFFKTHTKFKGELQVACIINCEGKLIRCEIDVKSGDDELDRQVLA